ncbi:MAG TPA: hypothetical protein DCE44_08235 [Verrucomicrobiales bacterium]|nr:hypothetical protein [Verrucomicrobiales bacterium]
MAAFVVRLHVELEADFRRRFNRALEIFFDKEDIQDFDHWQVRCHRALRDSRFFIACLSRSYLRSDACRWEWEEWCRHELEHGLVSQGAASLWFVKLEDLDRRRTPRCSAVGRATCSSASISNATSGGMPTTATSLMRRPVPNCSNSPSMSLNGCACSRSTVPGAAISLGRTRTSSGANWNWPACALRCSMRRSKPRLDYMASAVWARPRSRTGGRTVQESSCLPKSH